MACKPFDGINFLGNDALYVSCLLNNPYKRIYVRVKPFFVFFSKTLPQVTQLVSKMGCNRLLQERLDLETGTLEKAAVIQNQKKFQQAYIRMKTRLFFKQQKFNLLREEIEGYSKLATELYECKKPEETLENIKSLIGCFNMDPNRVLDICLEWLEHSVSNPVVARKLISNYLRLCDSSTLTNLLGFKFQFYATAPQGTPER